MIEGFYMTATGKSILKHPTREEINERLLAGESVEAVSKWLKQRHSRNPKMWVNKMTLQAYRRNFLDLDGEVLAELKKERAVKLAEERKRRASEIAQSSGAYQLAKKKYAEGYAYQIENTNEMLQTIYSKMEERIAIIEMEPTKHLNDKVIVEQCRLMKDVLKDHFEMQQQLKEEQQTHINIDVAKITGEVKALKTAIRRAVTRVCPEAWDTFLEVLKEEMDSASIQMAEEVEEDEDMSVNVHIKT